ncbi:hypothetical protein C0416_02505 [bacterium]|nr:hypothetical protein [bacterium]
MKKLMALIALVAMVAVSSVAYAQTGTVTVTGTINSSVDIDDCTAPLGVMTSGGTANTTCNDPVNVVANTGFGVNVQSIFTSTNLVNGSTADTIATLNDSAIANESCTVGSECWSMGAVSLSTGTPTYGPDKDTATNGEGSWDAAGDQHGISVTLADVLITDTATGPLAATFDMNFWATIATTTDAGSYSNATGTLTIAANVL